MSGMNSLTTDRMTQKSVKIVIANFGHRFNKGTAALLYTRVATIRRFIPNAEFVIFTDEPEIPVGLNDVEVKDAVGKFSSFGEITRTLFCVIKCSLWLLLNKLTGWDIKRLRKHRGLDDYFNASAVISIGGDTLTEDYGFFTLLSNVVNLSFGFLLKTPVMIYAESVGPFKGRLSRMLAKLFFDRVDLITVREDISRECLKDLGITSVPSYTVADSAFLLEPASANRIDQILEREGLKDRNRPFVGISTSSIIHGYGSRGADTSEERCSRYLKVMARVVDYLTEAMNATVIFVPHVTEPRGSDDRTVADNIRTLVKHRRDVISIKNEYTAEETKGIIGRCDLFIGARMHATIASATLGVPTIALAYSQKTHGIIGGMLGCEQYIVDIGEFEYEKMVSVIDLAWKNREALRSSLGSTVQSSRQRALLSGQLLKELVLDREGLGRESSR